MIGRLLEQPIERGDEALDVPSHSSSAIDAASSAAESASWSSSEPPTTT